MQIVITGLTVMTVPQGTRLGYTYSEIDDEGTTTKDNEKGNFIVLDSEVQAHIDAIKKYVQERVNENS